MNAGYPHANDAAQALRDNTAKWQVAVTLAAAVIGNMKRPLSIEEAHEIATGCFHELFPTLGSSANKAWKESGGASKVRE